jgi:hypothetical protein
VSDRIVKISDDFWNIRGSFKLGGVIDVGTQTSLVRMKRGDFVLLDSYAFTGEVEREVLALTDGGRAVRAILNLHPFHTVHVKAIARQFPQAQLYGTSRHKARAPGLRWQALHTDDVALHAQFADDFSFSVPRGVDLVPHSEMLHFASVLAFHKASGTLHVDDTLSFSNMPLLKGLKLHPTLRFALQKRRGAAAEFRAWSEELIQRCVDVKQLCPAHARVLPPPPTAGTSVADQVRGAVAEVANLLDAHARRYG